MSVGKVLDARDHESQIVDIDKLIDELSDIEDLSGFSSSSSETSEESQQDNESLKRKKTDSETKTKRRRRKKQKDSDDDSDGDEEYEEKPIDPNTLRNKMVQHLEQMRLAKQKMKKSIEMLFKFHDLLSNFVFF